MIYYPDAIRQSGLTIYDAIYPDNPYLYIPTDLLEEILCNHLIGISLAGLALRTRSKVVKSEICKALGYPVPRSFVKTQPRFPAQNFDVYIQKSLNVQIWNEGVDSNRRYVFVREDNNGTITAVKVICGDELARYDRTGTLTRKYQAVMNAYGHDICSPEDSETVRNWILDSPNTVLTCTPNSLPCRHQLLRISELYRRLSPMVGKTIRYLDADQERNRGAELHAMICHHLGYTCFEDNGAYPDIANQLLEVKLQTSPTIDLGLHAPDDGQRIATVGGTSFYSYDIRYAIFDGTVVGDCILLRNLYLVTGVDFTQFFPLFRGKGTNAKIQIPLPRDFFD